MWAESVRWRDWSRGVVSSALAWTQSPVAPSVCPHPLLQSVEWFLSSFQRNDITTSLDSHHMRAHGKCLEEGDPFTKTTWNVIGQTFYFNRTNQIFFSVS